LVSVLGTPSSDVGTIANSPATPKALPCNGPRCYRMRLQRLANISQYAYVADNTCSDTTHTILTSSGLHDVSSAYSMVVLLSSARSIDACLSGTAVARLRKQIAAIIYNSTPDAVESVGWSVESYRLALVVSTVQYKYSTSTYSHAGRRV
jgi:hypothetical protein